MTSLNKAVFDCNVLLQAMISPGGPAGRLFAAAKQRKPQLYISGYVLDELRELANRPRVARKYRLIAEIMPRFCDELLKFATLLDTVPHVFDFPRDPDDAHYVDLALATGAQLIVSRDRDLLSLRDATTSEGRDFMARFPALEILTPPEALSRLDDAGAEGTRADSRQWLLSAAERFREKAVGPQCRVA